MEVLVCRPSGGLGDVLCTTPALRAARLARPNDKIIYMTDRKYLPLLEGNPNADELKAFSRNVFRRMGNLRLMPPVFFLLQGPEVRHEVETRFNPTKSRAEIFCEIIGSRPDTWRPFYRVTEEENLWASKELLGRRRPLIAVQRQSVAPVRTYPHVDRLVAGLHASDLGVLLVDEENGWTPRQLCAIIANCDCVVSNDSAPVHIAAAVGTACVGLFGPTNPLVVLKKYLARNFVYIWGRAEGRSCQRPCYGSGTVGADEVCNGGNARCLASIQPLDVVDKVKQVLEA